MMWPLSFTSEQSMLIIEKKLLKSIFKGSVPLYTSKVQTYVPFNLQISKILLYFWGFSSIYTQKQMDHLNGQIASSVAKASSGLQTSWNFVVKSIYNWEDFVYRAITWLTTWHLFFIVVQMQHCQNCQGSVSRHTN